MLPEDALAEIIGDLRRLYDHVLSTETSLLSSNDPGYPLYMVHVPCHGMKYVRDCRADLFFV